MSLTKTQLKALTQLSKGRVNGKFMPMTLSQLVALGYAQKEMSVAGWHWVFAITDAGRAALNPSPQQNVGDHQPRYTTTRLHDEIARAKEFERRVVLEEAIVIVAENDVATAIRKLRALMRSQTPQVDPEVRPIETAQIGHQIIAHEPLYGWLVVSKQADGSFIQKASGNFWSDVPASVRFTHWLPYPNFLSGEAQR
ncbi:hypothetical protein [Rhizobium sp. Leaf386]|uniref:hypothetical protein n=1 Tax=Rhizobium sp. Leaf386 TaxID=1736359 RepID=UPI0007133EF0|nr:hypothetical protein [Rhizobium sp. Leaf386]KQS90336.1 hypothetical protein ASG50_07730 [Rhizobium sp. Leaf386]